MKRLIPLVIAGLFAAFVTTPGRAAEEEPDLFVQGTTADLKEFLWKKRPVVVFADSEFDPAFIEQIELLRANEDELLARDVVVLIDTDPVARSPLRLKLRPRGFMLALIGKDGGVKLRKPFPWDVREITRSIDKMPIRKREIREEKERSGNVIR